MQMNPPTLKTALGIFIPTLFIYLLTYSAPPPPLPTLGWPPLSLQISPLSAFTESLTKHSKPFKLASVIVWALKRGAGGGEGGREGGRGMRDERGEEWS